MIPSEAEGPAVLRTPLSSSRLRKNHIGKNRYGVKARRADTKHQPSPEGLG
jgi:hypothetical protein